MKNIFTSLLFVLLISILGVYAQGSNKALFFPATAERENIYLGNLPLDTTNFTIEMWLNVENVTSDEAFFSNKDWASGNNTGIALAMTSATTLKLNFKAPNGSRVDINNVAGDFIHKWNHVAVVVNRTTPSASVYINGVLGGSSTSANLAKSNGSIASTYPYRLGQDGTGNYSISYDGNNTSYNGLIDEVKIWNTALTQNQIQTNMCQKLALPQSNLVAYYNMDMVASASIYDNSGNGYSGNLSSANNLSVPTWETSGAPVGDNAVFQYNTNWSGVLLSNTSTASGSMNVQNITGFDGVHIYQVTETPNTQNGIAAADADTAYFGIFAVGTGSAFGVYDYTNYPNANTYEALTQLYKRNNNADTLWTIATATKNSTNNTFSFNVVNQAEYKIGNFTQNCGNPTTLNATNINFNSATLNWIGSGSLTANIAWGLQGTTPATATIISNVAGGTYNLTGLNAQTTYTFFVQDSCAGMTNPSWTGPFIFTTSVNTSTLKSAVSALSFAGTNTQYVSCGNYPIMKVANNITLEAWIKPQANQIDYAAALGFLQDNASNESGYGLVWHAGKWRMFMNTVNMAGNAWNNSPGADVPTNTWAHIAGTYDGSKIRFYMNGMLMDSSAQTGDIDWAYNPLDFRIGTFYDDNENLAYKGELDEIRVWSKAKTIQEIRAEMCHGLQGNETALVAYYRCNEKTGNLLLDATTNAHNGTITHPQTAWINSGAAIGETSVYSYPNNWNGVNVNIATANKGSLQINNLNGNAKGAHLYYAPLSGTVTNGIQDLNNNDTYFGSFIVEGNIPTQYDYAYNYTNYPAAATAENNIRMYNRWDNSYLNWIDYGMTANTTPNTQTAAKVMGSREWALGSFSPINCVGSYSISANNITASQADIDWNSLAANNWDFEYGTAYFAQGTGTVSTNLPTSNKGLTNLLGTTLYDVYVKDYCTTTSSNWVGPFRFYTQDACPNPSNLNATVTGLNTATISWISGGSTTWNIQYGIQNFTLGLGVPINNLTTNPYFLTGLSAGTAYDLYLQDTCGVNGGSNWIGPITFTTSGTSIELPTVQNLIHISPNPAHQNFDLTFKDISAQSFEIKILDMQGKQVFLKSFVQHNLIEAIELPILATGMYQCVLSNEKATQCIKLIIE